MRMGSKFLTLQTTASICTSQIWHNSFHNSTIVEHQNMTNFNNLFLKLSQKYHKLKQDTSGNLCSRSTQIVQNKNLYTKACLQHLKCSNRNLIIHIVHIQVSLFRTSHSLLNHIHTKKLFRCIKNSILFTCSISMPHVYHLIRYRVMKYQE